MYVVDFGMEFVLVFMFFEDLMFLNWVYVFLWIVEILGLVVLILSEFIEL